ncbi:MAG: cyclase family protein [Flavobacteriales bacterium]
MKTTIEINNSKYELDLSKPLDISMRLSTEPNNSSAWYVDPISIEPVQGEGFIGSVAQGGSVNFRNITFNPHGNGTHTETVGHIDKEIHSINKHLKTFHFLGQVITVTPTTWNTTEGTRNIGDFIITKEQLKEAIGNNKPEALILRTLPNDSAKLSKQYSNTNPPYLCHEAALFLREMGVNHLLIDLPSVDKEVDGGELLSHKAFWNYPADIQYHKTITEFIFVNNEIKDGLYLLNLQIAPFENDASPSKPVLYKINKL